MMNLLNKPMSLKTCDQYIWELIFWNKLGIQLMLTFLKYNASICRLLRISIIKKKLQEYIPLYIYYLLYILYILDIYIYIHFTLYSMKLDKLL